MCGVSYEGSVCVWGGGGGALGIGLWDLNTGRRTLGPKHWGGEPHESWWEIKAITLHPRVQTSGNRRAGVVVVGVEVGGVIVVSVL